MFRSKITLLVLGIVLAVAWASICAADKLDEMSLERWTELREVERYQLQIAEEYFRKKDWKVAAAEYEKYLALYERSEAGPYAQLKWSLCQVEQRKSNTAVKEGFQSVIDYWPDSPEAVAAAYYIGRTCKDMGQIPAAKKAYEGLLEDHPKHFAAVRALVDLVEIAGIEKDRDAQVELWKKLTFDVPRTKESRQLCSDASKQLASHHFALGSLDDGVKALATTYQEGALPPEVAAHLRGPLGQLAAGAETRAKGEKLASAAVAYFRREMPSDTSDPEKKALARQYWYYIAEVYAAARLDSKVEATYSQMLKDLGTDDETLGRLAGWYKSQRRYEDARRTYRRFADKIEGLSRTARSYRDEGQHEPAVAVYRDLARRDADDRVRWTAEIASTYHDARKYKEAIAVYQELLTLDPEHSETWRWRVATAFRDSGQHKEAIAWYRQCTNFPSNYKEMASCHRRLKQYNEALALYAQIAGGDPPSAPWAMLQIAHTREDAGQKEQAIKAFQQVCRQFPKDSHASRAHAHLQSKYNISITLGGAKDE